MKLNKNGIPILDPPGNKMKKKKSCLPDEHHWVESKPELEIMTFPRLEGTHYHCTNCDEHDFVPDPIDEQDLPWL